jgi:hypothetical protein
MNLSAPDRESYNNAIRPRGFWRPINVVSESTHHRPLEIFQQFTPSASGLVKGLP